MSTIPVYDPRGVVEATALALAPRVKQLKRVRLALLDNTKWNANKLLRLVRDELAQSHQLTASYYRKESFSRFADPALLARIRAENDIVVTAIAD
jgi:hypothetical protein